MTKVGFERVVRDCPYNDRLGPGDRGFIYDFDVLVDGERRATFWRVVSGYRLRAPDGEPITVRPVPTGEGPRSYEATAESKADFARVVEDLLRDGRVPTAEDVAARVAGVARADAENAEIEEAGARRRGVEKHALSLLEALSALVEAPSGARQRVAAADLLARVRADAEDAVASHRALGLPPRPPGR